MKKLIIPILCILFMATSCIEGDSYYEESSSNRMIVKDILVTPSQWEIDGTAGEEGACVVSYWEVDEITQNVLRNGSIQVSYYFYNSNNQLVEHPLPYVLPYTGTPNIIETIRCYYQRGLIVFVKEDSDFQCYIPDENMRFKVVITQQ